MTAIVSAGCDGRQGDCPRDGTRIHHRESYPGRARRTYTFGMRWGRAWLGSVALHCVVLIGLALLPEPPPGPAVPLAFTEIELIEVPSPKADASGSEPKRTPKPPDAETEAPGDSPTPRPRPRAPAQPSIPAPSAPKSVDPATRPSALPLLGLRRDDAGGRAPRLPRGAMLPLPSEGPDRPPNADAAIPATPKFVRDRRGRLVFRDPDPKAKWTAELLPDGRVKFADHIRPTMELNDHGRLIVRMGTPADRIRKAQGTKLWVQRKKELLAATRPMRLKMAVAFAEKNIDRQLARLVGDLLEIWNSDKPPYTRRALLFETWDDCQESLVVQLDGFTDEASAVDEIRRNAATRARQKIIAFIRRHVPAGDAEAFTKDEIAGMNRRRRSRERFDPYAA